MKRRYSEEEAKAIAGNYLKGLIKKKGLGYKILAERLRRRGWRDNERSLANRFSRGGFSAGFFIVMLDILGEEDIQLRDLEIIALKTEKKALDLRYSRKQQK